MSTTIDHHPKPTEPIYLEQLGVSPCSFPVLNFGSIRIYPGPGQLRILFDSLNDHQARYPKAWVSEDCHS